MPEWNEDLFQEVVKKVLKMSDKVRVEAMLRDVNQLAAVVQLQQKVASINLQNFRQIKDFMELTLTRLKIIEEKLALIEVFDRENGDRKAGKYTQ